jgi:hypothetical protein
MMCLTALMSGDVRHIQEIDLVQVRDEKETQRVIAYLHRIKELTKWQKQ